MREGPLTPRSAPTTHCFVFAVMKKFQGGIVDSKQQNYETIGSAIFLLKTTSADRLTGVIPMNKKHLSLSFLFCLHYFLP